MSQVTCSAGPQADVVSYADADLLAQLRAGDEAAMAQLVDQWSPAMFRVARSFVDSAQSDDWLAGPGGEPARTWSSIDDMSRWDTAPENVVLSKETLLELDRALSGLPGRQRQVVTMRDVCGMSSEEVCAALEISPVNQRVLLHRARAVLRAALAGYYRG